MSITFLNYMNVNQYQKYHKNTRNMKKGILASNIGALPILQECPCLTKKIVPTPSIIILMFAFMPLFHCIEAFVYKYIHCICFVQLYLIYLCIGKAADDDSPPLSLLDDIYYCRRHYPHPSSARLPHIYSGLVTRRLYFLKKYDAKQPNFPSCRN